jgi:hypothetical protein
MYEILSGDYRRNSARVHGITIEKTIMLNYHVNKKQSRYRPGVAQRVPGR